MGLRHLMKKVEVVNVLSKEYKEKPHLDVEGEIIVGKHYSFDIPEIDVRFEGYFPARVRLWPYDRPSRSPSPIVSSIYFIYLFIYLFILYLKVDKHLMQLCTLKK